MTRGLRNNNPLNIRRSADRWEGTATTQTDQSFVQFKGRMVKNQNRHKRLLLMTFLI